MVVGELTQERDVIIIGGGPGGYHAAIRAAQLGLQVTLIEKGELGGVCLNEGCIPSKVHTAAAQQLNQLSSMNKMGIQTSPATFNLPTLQEYKVSTINQLKKGIEALCKANKIELIKGEATFISSEKIGVEWGHQYDTYTFKHAIIATGSHKKPLLNIRDNHLTVTSIWKLEELPSELILYGSDDITLEAAMSFRKLGSEITIIFPKNQTEFTFDTSINKELTRQFKKQKIKMIKGVSVESAQLSDEGWVIELKNKEEQTQKCMGTHFFVAAETMPVNENLGLDRAGIKLTHNGWIDINEVCQTNKSNIYAIGDITPGPALAVKAIKQGKVAAESIAGISSEVDLTFIPRVLHTIPPIASVGLTEIEARESGHEINIGESSLKTSGYASILGQKDGFVKTISEKDTELVLGVHIIGLGAIELISSGTFALEMVGREEDLLFPLYPHPSINESLLESLDDLSNKAIHKAPSSNNQKVIV
ncbi:dihydrolipoyl dehydrogenase [Sutcliffiella halmapala]|uniref:dihydrolipoyl dehydrogenase n=1 Tax=Sutcliffiella halmapala TaxID=79882 RepID=UPI000995A4A7|nr:dihydrolipoyl dehydrogenase [Sutcliffiella halmapala]